MHTYNYRHKSSGTKNTKGSSTPNGSKKLWLLECMEGKLGRIFTLYANSQEDAETQVQEYYLLHPELTHVSLSERPDGFIFFNFRRPGSIECKEQG